MITNIQKKLFAFLLLIGSIFLFLSHIPSIYEATLADKLPADRTMVWGEHLHTYDYNVYLSKIKQGSEGRWTIVDKYDNDLHQKGIFLHMLYLSIGKVGGALNLDPVMSFHLAKLIFSFVWIVLLIILNFHFLKKPPLVIVGFILCILASSLPLFIDHNGARWVDHFMPWWQEMDVLKRLNYFPHYTLNYIIIAVLSILLVNQNNNVSRWRDSVSPERLRGASRMGRFAIPKLQRRREGATESAHFRFVIITIVFFFSFFIHPSAGVTFLFSWVLFHLLTTKKLIDFPFKKTGILLIAVAIYIIYFHIITVSYPWKTLAEPNATFDPNFTFTEYFFALGPILITGVIGGLMVMRQKNITLLPLVTWVIGAFLSYFIFRFIPDQYGLRFIQNANHVPLAILSVYLLSFLTDQAQMPVLSRLGIPRVRRGEGSHWSRKTRYQAFRKIMQITKITTIIYFFGIMLLGLIHSYFSLKRQTDFIRQRVYASIPLVPYPSQVMYPLTDFWNGVMWLKKNGSRNEVVLSKFTAGNYIPAYSNNFVFLGHALETPNFKERGSAVTIFFQGMLSPKTARKFLTNQHITYIFYGPQEKENAQKTISDYDFLTPVYNSFYVTIFKVTRTYLKTNYNK